MQPFQERHGFKACVVAPTKIIAGLSMSLGMEVLDVPGATGEHLNIPCRSAKPPSLVVSAELCHQLSSSSPAPPLEWHPVRRVNRILETEEEQRPCLPGNLDTEKWPVKALRMAVWNAMVAALLSKHSCGYAGDYKTEFHVKAEAIAEALGHGDFDFGFLHVKAVDDTGHDRAAAMKVQALFNILGPGVDNRYKLNCIPSAREQYSSASVPCSAWVSRGCLHTQTA